MSDLSDGGEDDEDYGNGYGSNGSGVEGIQLKLDASQRRIHKSRTPYAQFNVSNISCLLFFVEVA